MNFCECGLGFYDKRYEFEVEMQDWEFWQRNVGIVNRSVGFGVSL